MPQNTNTNLIFTKSIDSNQESNWKKIKVLGSIKGSIEEIHNQGLFCKRHQTLGTQIDWNQGWNWRDLKV